jgi:hypothetical protein
MPVLVLAAILAGAASGVAALQRHVVWADVLLLIALTFSALAVHGPNRRSGMVVFGIGAALFCVLSVSSVSAVSSAVAQVTTPAALLVLGLFALVVAAVVVGVAASWLPRRRYVEPAALGIFTLIVGALSLQGLHLLSVPASMPTTNGFAMLYTRQAPGEKLYLDVTVGPLAEAEAFEGFVIDNPTGNRPVPWALLIAGDARLAHRDPLSPGVREQPLTLSGQVTGDSHKAPAQLFSGTLRSGTTQGISGLAIGSFSNASTSRTAVSLPDYGSGAYYPLDLPTAIAVVRALHGTITIPPRISVSVDAGNVNPFNTDVHAIPPLTDPAKLSWNTSTYVGPQYTTSDQNAAAENSNYLFALAILLAVAGSGLLASLQAALHAASAGKKDE